MNFKINARPLFTIIFKLKNDNFKTREFSPFIERVLASVRKKEGGLLLRAIQFLENIVNKLLLFNFIIECKGKKLRTHSAEPLVEGLTFFQLSCPLFAVAAVCIGQLSSTICGVSIKKLQN